MFREIEELRSKLSDLMAVTHSRQSRLRATENNAADAIEMLELTNKSIANIIAVIDEKLLTITAEVDLEGRLHLGDKTLLSMYHDGSCQLHDTIAYWRKDETLKRVFLRGWYERGKWIVGIYDNPLMEHNPKQGVHCLEEVTI